MARIAAKLLSSEGGVRVIGCRSETVAAISEEQAAERSKPMVDVYHDNFIGGIEREFASRKQCKLITPDAPRQGVPGSRLRATSACPLELAFGG